ncbi:MAG: hypothetical protein ACXWA3_00895, partial [Acidimicrobiales bacterium]
MFDVAGVVRECRQGTVDDLGLVSDDELLAAAVGLQAVRSGVAVVEARVLGEVQARGLTDRRFGVPTAGWVAAEAGVDRVGVARRVRLGSWLRRLPVVADAVVCGELSVDHAEVLVRAVANPR